MANRARTGRRGEDRAAQSLRRSGFSVTRSPGSRGPSDLTAVKPRKKWRVQVKSSEGPRPAWPSGEEIGRLVGAATNQGATPVVGLVPGQRGPAFFSARTRRRLKP
jgi:Holliday junction resolvase